MLAIKVTNRLRLINYTLKILPVCCTSEWFLRADNTRTHFSIGLVLRGARAHLSIQYSQYLHFLFFEVKGNNQILFMHTFFFCFQESKLVIRVSSNVLNTAKDIWKLAVAIVSLYGFASRSSLMSLMPCSAATAMMWSRAFMWPNIFTASLTRSLLADTV